jgi:hypothetical protein
MPEPYTSYVALRKAFSGSYMIKLYMMLLRVCKKATKLKKYIKQGSQIFHGIDDFIFAA